MRFIFFIIFFTMVCSCLSNLGANAQRAEKQTIFKDKWFKTSHLLGNTYFAEIRRQERASNWDDAEKKCRDKYNAGLARFKIQAFENLVAAYTATKLSGNPSKLRLNSFVS